MKLEINNEIQHFIPIQTFRAQWELPNTFAVSGFEPKDWTGLGSLDGSGERLAIIKQRVLAAIPPHISSAMLLGAVDTLTVKFRQELEAANVEIGLRSSEIDFAVAGFGDVLQSAAYQLIQLLHRYRDSPAEGRQNFSFTAVYQTWLNESTRISTTTFSYTQNQIHFAVRVINNAYGRIGLEVQTGDQRFYVLDTELACPASGYMYDLCNDVAQGLCRSIFSVDQD